MPASFTSERKPLGEQLPVICLFGILLLLSLSLIYPSGAYPWHGTGMAAGALLLFLVASRLFRWPSCRLARAAVLLPAAWAILWGAMLLRAPVYTIGRAPAYAQIFCAVLFLTACAAAAGWKREELLPEETGEPAHGQMSPLVLFAGWLAVLIACVAAHGVYQVLGPEWLPKTFRAMQKDILLLPADDPMRDGLLHAMRERRASGVIGAPNIFASFCVFGFPIAAACALSARGRAEKAAYALCAIVIVAAIILSGSQGGVLSLAAALVVMAALLACYRLAGKSITRMAAGAAVVFILFFAAFVGVKFASGNVSNRWLGGSGMTQRFYYWKTAASIWKEHPILGAGPGGFEVFYPSHRSAGSNETKHAHSWLFDDLAQTGLLGAAMFSAFLAVCASGAARLLARLRGDGRRRGYVLSAGLIAACFAILFHGLTEYTLSFREAAAMLFAAMGFLAGIYISLREDPDSGASLIARALLLAGAALFASAIYFFQYVPANSASLREEADYLYTEGETSLQVIGAASDAVAADPRNAECWEALGHYQAMVRDARALVSLERAMALNPWSARLRETLALYYADRGDAEKALDNQRRAIELHPQDAGHRMTLAELLMKYGKQDEAAETFRATIGLKPTTASESRRQKELAEKLGVDLPR